MNDTINNFLNSGSDDKYNYLEKYSRDLQPYKEFKVDVRAIDHTEEEMIADGKPILDTDLIENGTICFIADEHICQGRGEIDRLITAISEVLETEECTVRKNTQDYKGHGSLFLDIDFPNPVSRSSVLDRLEQAYIKGISHLDQSHASNIDKKRKGNVNEVFDSFLEILKTTDIPENERARLAGKLAEKAVEILSKKTQKGA